MWNLRYDGFRGHPVVTRRFGDNLSHRKPLVGNLQVKFPPIERDPFGSTIAPIDHSKESFDAIHSSGMTQFDRQTVHDRIRMVLSTFGQLVPNPLDRQAKRSAATVVSRMFMEQVLGKQIPDHKPVPSPFGSEAPQLSKDMDGDDDFVFLFQQMTISTLKMNLDTR